MELDKLYQALERLENDGEIVNAYGGPEKDIDHMDGLTLADFTDYIYVHYYENYSGERPVWMETFFQVFDWQYSAMYEGADGYYSNDYGTSDYQTITKVADYLKNNGYTVVAEQYIRGIDGCKRNGHTYEKTETAKQIEMWISWNTEPVWEFYLDILKKHKNDWPEL